MLVVLPILAPMLGAALCLTLWGRARGQAAVAVLTTGAVLACAIALLFTVRASGTQVVELGGWAAPFGIVLVADLFGAIMVLLGAAVGFAVAIFSVGTIDPLRAQRGHYPLTLCLLAACSGAFVAGDLFNLYVWFELMLMSSFVLLTLGGERGQLEGAIKYVTLNLFSSVVFLAGVGLIYGVTGTLNMAHLAIRMDALNDPALATALAAPLLVGFGIKAAVFPLFFWLPASYHTPPPAVSALFAGLLTKVGVYSIIRTTILIFDQEWTLLGDALLIVAGLTMVSGVLGAMTQNDMRRILSFHIVSQIGYMLMGLGIALRLLGQGQAIEAAVMALTGSVFYILHHILVKTNLFLISGAVLKLRGTCELSDLGGITRTNPFLSALFFITSMSLAGIPILSGFWAKFTLVRGGLEGGAYGIVGVSLFVSVCTLFSMIKIWSQGFWREAPEDANPAAITVANRPAIYGPIIALACVTIGIGISAGPAFSLAKTAAEELIDNSNYIAAVLGEDALEADPMDNWEEKWGPKDEYAGKTDGAQPKPDLAAVMEAQP